MILGVAMAFQSRGMGNFVSVIIALFSLLFCGALVQRDTTPPGTAWVHYGSYLNYVYELLTVNELANLTISFTPKGARVPKGTYVTGQVYFEQVGAAVSVCASLKAQNFVSLRFSFFVFRFSPFFGSLCFSVLSVFLS